jgi:hypothetical protein
MSLALDLGLFLRNSKTKLGFSLNHRGLLFTLAIRIGNNSKTWIKQSTFSKEVGVEESAIRKSLAKIKKTKFIIVENQKTDKRMKQYKFNPLLTNYHLLNEDEKRKVHAAFDDEYDPPSFPKAISKTKKYRAKSPGNSEDTAQNCLVNTGNNCAVSLLCESSLDAENKGVEGIENSPKVKAQSNTQKQNKRELGGSLDLQNIPDDFYPDSTRRELLSQHAKRTNNPEHELLSKFETISKTYKTKSKDWQQTFEEFLLREMPKRTFEDKTGQRKRYDGQSLHY